jgi:transcription initiation factor TFIIH subunit 2
VLGTLSPESWAYGSHSTLNRGGYICPRCSSKVCSLPIECPVCSLTLILSTHLARSYHHLFPLRNWPEAPYSESFPSPTITHLTFRKITSTHCYGCQTPFPPIQKPQAGVNSIIADAATGTQRFVCPACLNHFCIECDLYCHEVLHNCPGCERVSMGTNGTHSTEANGDSEAMMID